jgi:hypothetical protein
MEDLTGITVRRCALMTSSGGTALMSYGGDTTGSVRFYRNTPTGDALVRFGRWKGRLQKPPLLALLWSCHRRGIYMKLS